MAVEQKRLFAPLSSRKAKKKKKEKKIQINLYENVDCSAFNSAIFN